MTGRQRIQSLIAGEPTDRPPLMPITMMFAADQVAVPYKRYATDHRALVAGQLAAAERFGFDHVSAISDPAREAADCGATVHYPDDAPPALVEADALLADTATLATLAMPDPLAAGSRMLDRVRGVAALRRAVGDNLLVEGWVEGPCAEAADLRGINTLMMDLIEDARFVDDLFAFVVELATRFARAQVEAGADIIGVGDAAASLIGPALYESLVWPREKQLVDAIHAMGAGVRLHICGNTRPVLEPIGRLGCEIVDLDAPAPMAEARAAMGDGQVLAGNIDPVRVLRAGPVETITAALADCRRAAGARYAVAAGCEVPRDTPAEHVAAMAAFAESCG